MSDNAAPCEDFLRELVAIPSVTGSEGLIKDYLVNKFNSLGFDTRVQHVDGDRYNVIGTLGEGPIRLMLCTHEDVIPSLDESKWTTHPFQPSEREGRIYGRGATDAKGSLAAMMEAMARLKGKLLNGSVAIAAVVEEETGRSIGARRLLTEYRPEMAIIGEPTGLRAAVAHKGALRPAITVHGMAAHASHPGRGVNAISAMGKLLVTLNSYAYRVSKNKDPLLGRSSSEATMIRGGERINVIPEQCTVCIDRRLVSNETIDEAYHDLQMVVRRFSRKYRARAEIELLSSYPPSSTPLSEPIVKMASSVLSGMGLNPEPNGFPAGCDMWAFRARDIPTVILGPGSIQQAHVIDEYIEIAELRKAVDVYERLLQKASQ
ncbi:M20 family metallopeptidase [Methanocella arvoryzae]|uniref:Acetylornithine deacetylase n=1 Tax=Methanocella arvoryzae (strain DSM 22066 / NBRC 105507 / MRE50) TaxID=351160 RepID=Q0W5T9_METAR|nr:M20 family metallopeptidase [Methanocella arvoryzae]CAJ36254.1 acetylornithine deacetylase [Methanocella arvoryzae MRE50]